MEIFKRYVMLCVGLLIVAFGVAFFDSGGSGDLADLVSALCGEYAVPADGGGGNDRDALHIHSDSDGAFA